MKKTTCLTTILGLILVGCGGGGGDAAPLPSATATAPTSKPLVDFSALIFPWFAGSYTGSVCSNGPSATSTEALDIAADGTVKSGGLSSNFLVGSVVISAGRKFDASGPTSTMVIIDTVTTTAPKVGQRLVLDGERKGSFMTIFDLQLPITLVGCNQSSDVNKPMAKSMYSLVAKYIDSPSVTLSCLSSDKTFADATYQLLDGVVKFNKEIYPLTSGLKGEGVLAGPGTLSYSTGSLDGRAFQVVLDATGTPGGVVFTTSNGIANSCSFKK